LVISAAGVPNLVTKVKKDAILIDIGISRNENGKLCGDICNEAKKIASFYTPVPGGVGPLTVVMLMENVYHLWKAQQETLLHNCQLSNFF
jgi:methylenetetrahydrofolate dehydrogenase (NADP+)/methenyltetrahydrofolate cyclohydrolase